MYNSVSSEYWKTCPMRTGKHSSMSDLCIHDINKNVRHLAKAVFPEHHHSILNRIVHQVRIIPTIFVCTKKIDPKFSIDHVAIIIAYPLQYRFSLDLAHSEHIILYESRRSNAILANLPGQNFSLGSELPANLR